MYYAFRDLWTLLLYYMQIIRKFIVLQRYVDPSGKQSQYDTWNVAKRTGTEHVGCRILNPTVPRSVEFRKLLERDDRFASFNSKECCYGRQLSWQKQNPLYVEEPRWIKIDNDRKESHLRHSRLGMIDPFVISRGQKFHEKLRNIASDSKRGESPIEYEDPNVILADDPETIESTTQDRRSTYANSRLGRNKNNDNCDDSDDNNEEEKNLKRTDEKRNDHLRSTNYENSLFATRRKRVYDERKRYSKNEEESGRFEEVSSTFNKQKDKRGADFRKIPATYRSKDEIISRPIYTPRLTTFHMPIELARISRNAIGEKGNSVLFHVRMKRDSNTANSASAVVKNIVVESTYRPNWRYRHVRKRTPTILAYLERERRGSVGYDTLDSILGQPYFISEGKRTNNRYDEKILSERLESKEFESMIDSFVDKEMLREDLKCDSNKCKDRFSERERRTKKRQNHLQGNEMKEIVKDLLSKFDPFYASRGKRVSLPSLNESF